jgi:hypothetical protein
MGWGSAQGPPNELVRNTSMDETSLGALNAYMSLASSQMGMFSNAMSGALSNLNTTMPVSFSATDIDWAKKAESIRSAQEVAEAERNKKKRTLASTVHTSPLLADEDPNLTSITLG